MLKANLESCHHIFVSSAETVGGFNAGFVFDTVNLHSALPYHGVLAHRHLARYSHAVLYRRTLKLKATFENGS
jgi:hypothetical protein